MLVFRAKNIHVVLLMPSATFFRNTSKKKRALLPFNPQVQRPGKRDRSIKVTSTGQKPTGEDTEQEVSQTFNSSPAHITSPLPKPTDWLGHKTIIILPLQHSLLEHDLRDLQGSVKSGQIGILYQHCFYWHILSCGSAVDCKAGVKTLIDISTEQ